MSIHDNKLHVMLAATVLGEGISAPLVEIAACVFDPSTGQVTPEASFQIKTDIKKELRDGRATGDALCNFLLAHKYDMLVFNNVGEYVSAVQAVEELCAWIDRMRSEHGIKFEDTRVYVYQPHSIIPRLNYIHFDINGDEKGIWPSYGVMCAKTIMDMARPHIVEHSVDLPVRPPSKNGLADETNHQAIVLMHHMLMLTGDHPEQTGTAFKGQKVAKSTKLVAKPAKVYDNGDDEL